MYEWINELGIILYKSECEKCALREYRAKHAYSWRNT